MEEPGSGDVDERTVTRILGRIEDGESGALDDLIQMVYSELRQMAAGKMSAEAAGHTLQPTALVNDAYLRLVTGAEQHWENRRRFFGAAAEAMRRILIDHARAKKALKRGGDRARVGITHIGVPFQDSPVDVEILSEALEDLALKDPRAAEVVTLRYFAGLDVSEAAEVLGVSGRTVRGDWAYAKAWLQARLAK